MIFYKKNKLNQSFYFKLFMQKQQQEEEVQQQQQQQQFNCFYCSKSYKKKKDLNQQIKKT